MSHSMTRRVTLCTMAALAVPRLVSGCPVCFGATDGPMLQGSNMGILALLLVTLAVLGAFAMFFSNLARRARNVADATVSRTAGPAAAVSAEGSTR
jgi:hypothetical protein